MEDRVKLLLQRLHQCSDVISQAYHEGRVEKTEENSRQIEVLRQMRILQPDVRDAFQLRATARQFLNAVFNTERLLTVGRVTDDNFKQLNDLVDMYSTAFFEGRSEACDTYEIQIRESISDIADAMEDELTNLEMLVANKFGAVTTVAEKKRQNLWYQNRTQVLVDLLENFHFSDLEHRLSEHEELALSYRVLLVERIPVFRQSLIAILQRMKEFLFEYRQIEARAKRVREVWLQLDRNPGWTPRDWDEAARPPQWLQVAEPVALMFHPDVQATECEKELVEIASKIPQEPTDSLRHNYRPPGEADDEEEDLVIEVPPPAIKRAVTAYYLAAMDSSEGLSARVWWTHNPELLDGIRQDIWILRVITEYENMGKERLCHLEPSEEKDPAFDGNVTITDVRVAGIAG